MNRLLELTLPVLVAWWGHSPLVSPAYAQCEPTEKQKLLASDGAAGEYFGIAVSLSEDTAVVGTPRDDERGFFSGSACVFERAAGTWTQTAKLTADDATERDEFGSSVCVNGDILLVGAIYDTDLGIDSGSAYVFERVNGVWTQTAKLLASDGAAGDVFGRAISVSGESVVVGGRGGGPGAVYVFEKMGGVWTETAKLTASDGGAFGWSVSLCGDTAFVGAPFDDDGGAASGAAYVFERVGGAWTQVIKLTATDGTASDEFGHSISLSGEAAVVGAYKDTDYGINSGSAYVFERIGGVWSQTAKLTASDGSWGDTFGCAVDVNGDTALVGSFGDDDDGSVSGSAYLFERTGDVWSEVSKLTASDAAAGDQFGWSVSLSGVTAIVTAKFDDDRGQDSGSAYIFDLCPSCPADFNGDGVVDTRDVLAFLNAWTTQDPRADFNDDGTIDTRDVLAFLNAWTAGCERE